uniref:TLC domain-containing protein n=1 Tax=Oryza barthii TaxID=65489 RepID=A0A0D3EVG5_9ORYZ
MEEVQHECTHKESRRTNQSPVAPSVGDGPDGRVLVCHSPRPLVRGGMDGNFGSEERILWLVSVLAGIAMCAAVYDITQKVSSHCFKGYDNLSPMKKVEWNNRGFSTFHALVAAVVSFYLVVISDLFHSNIIIDRNSWLSDAMFGVSIGYFLTDLVMILWYFPSLGGKEYLLHHGLSMYAICLALLSGKAHMYILMVLFTEATTPFVNLRWYLEVAGKKTHNLYLYNGLALFVGWLVARVILFIYFFTHMYFHFDQVKSIFPLGFYSILTVPPALAVMNLFWFWKIFKGMLKTLSKRRQQSENGKAE